MTSTTVITEMIIQYLVEKIVLPRVMADESITPQDWIDYARAIEREVLRSGEIVAMQKDAARYRWLRSPASVDILDVHHWDGEIADGKALDAYIDTEMEKKS